MPVKAPRSRQQKLSLDTLRVDSFSPVDQTPFRFDAMITQTNCAFTHVDSTCPCCTPVGPCSF
jgi:hypothetical protein